MYEASSFLTQWYFYFLSEKKVWQKKLLSINQNNTGGHGFKSLPLHIFIIMKNNII